MAEDTRIRLGMVGCGAIAEFAYLPASRQLSDVAIVALADKNVARTERLGHQYGIDTRIDDYRALPKDLDGVVIALPHDLHAPVASQFLQQGTAVLVEKPIALNLNDARRVTEIAHKTGTLLQVGQIYRFCHRARIVKRAIEGEWLGNLRSFSLEGNFADLNPMASGFAWNKDQSGGGTLVDVGSLVLDLLIWWLGEPRNVTYRDDSRGGVECECELFLEFANRRGSVAGQVSLSRLRKLRDIVRIDGDKFSIVYGFETLTGLLELLPADRDYHVPFLLDSRSVPVQTSVDFFVEQLRNFAAAIRSPEASAAPGESVLASIGLIEECYRVRQPLNIPWETSLDLIPRHV